LTFVILAYALFDSRRSDADGPPILLMLFLAPGLLLRMGIIGRSPITLHHPIDMALIIGGAWLIWSLVALLTVALISFLCRWFRTPGWATGASGLKSLGGVAAFLGTALFVCGATDVFDTFRSTQTSLMYFGGSLTLVGVGVLALGMYEESRARVRGIGHQGDDR
jgi:hypothetical protein